jgi:hypothetical protein
MDLKNKQHMSEEYCMTMLVKLEMRADDDIVE